MIQSSKTNTNVLGPIGQAPRLAIKANIAVVVPILFWRGSPSTVSGFVIAVFVGIAIQTVLWRWLAPHVLKEVGKRAPAITDFNSSSTVKVKFGVLRVLRSLEHHFPRSVFSRVRHAVSFGPRNLPAPTRYGLAAFDGTSEPGGDRAARTLTLPFPFVSPCVLSYYKEFSDNSQASECHADIVLGYNFLSQSVNLLQVGLRLIRALGLQQQSQGSFILARKAL